MEMNRREFVKAGAGALAGVALGSSVSQARRDKRAPAAKLQHQEGDHDARTVLGSMSVMDKFKLIRGAGFEGVEPMRAACGSRSSDEGARCHGAERSPACAWQRIG